MEPLEFGKFIVQILQWFWDRSTFVIECKKGQAIVKNDLVSQLNGETSQDGTGNGLLLTCSTLSIFANSICSSMLIHFTERVWRKV